LQQNLIIIDFSEGAGVVQHILDRDRWLVRGLRVLRLPVPNPRYIVRDMILAQTSYP
jgi:hypothetical protein